MSVERSGGGGGGEDQLSQTKTRKERQGTEEGRNQKYADTHRTKGGLTAAFVRTFEVVSIHAWKKDHFTNKHTPVAARQAAGIKSNKAKWEGRSKVEEKEGQSNFCFFACHCPPQKGKWISCPTRFT